MKRYSSFRLFLKAITVIAMVFLVEVMPSGHVQIHRSPEASYPKRTKCFNNVISPVIAAISFDQHVQTNRSRTLLRASRAERYGKRDGLRFHTMNALQPDRNFQIWLHHSLVLRAVEGTRIRFLHICFLAFAKEYARGSPFLDTKPFLITVDEPNLGSIDSLSSARPGAKGVRQPETLFWPSWVSEEETGRLRRCGVTMCSLLNPAR